MSFKASYKILPIKLLIDNWIVILFSILGFALIIINTHKYGAGLSPDSIFYITNARRIIDNPIFLFQNNCGLVIWPPIYPIMLSLVSLLSNSDPLQVAHYFNGILFSCFLVFTYLQVNIATNSKFISFTILSLILTNYIVINVFVMAWSEPLFITLISASLYYLVQYSKHYNLKNLIIFSILVSLISLTRYIGIIFVFSGFISLLAIFYLNKIYKYKHLIVFLIISLLPILLWFFRNYLLTETISGIRIKSDVTIIQNISLSYDVFKQFFYSYGRFETLENLFLITFLNLIIFVILYLLFRRYKFFQTINYHVESIVLVVFCMLSYFIFLCISQSYVMVNPIGYRHVLPLYSLLLIIYFSVIIFIKYFLSKLNRLILSKVIVIASIIVLVPSFYFNAINSKKYSLNNFKNGLHSKYRKMNTNMTIEYLKNYNLTSSIHLFSNDPWSINLYSSKNSCFIPIDINTSNHNHTYDLHSSISKNKVFYLVWIYDQKIYDVSILEKIFFSFNPDTIMKFEDGIFLKFVKK